MVNIGHAQMEIRRGVLAVTRSTEVVGLYFHHMAWFCEKSLSLFGNHQSLHLPRNVEDSSPIQAGEGLRVRGESFQESGQKRLRDSSRTARHDAQSAVSRLCEIKVTGSHL